MQHVCQLDMYVYCVSVDIKTTWRGVCFCSFFALLILVSIIFLNLTQSINEIVGRMLLWYDNGNRRQHSYLHRNKKRRKIKFS